MEIAVDVLTKLEISYRTDRYIHTLLLQHLAVVLIILQN
jgi:hypothetical protein